MDVPEASDDLGGQDVANPRCGLDKLEGVNFVMEIGDAPVDLSDLSTERQGHLGGNVRSQLIEVKTLFAPDFEDLPRRRQDPIRHVFAMHFAHLVTEPPS
ncbi:hypothetical protein [Ferrimicrobium acidiphilum]|uniref:hypothetical protein n=1 Tax=Ferrimicrobium acidiphilum TaxID=121039 RepID=UPI0023F1BAE1|nr:hypothetical protein [Ferrimicrobium acidiphilum]